jgi:hypothetical protein
LERRAITKRALAHFHPMPPQNKYINHSPKAIRNTAPLIRTQFAKPGKHEPPFQQKKEHHNLRPRTSCHKYKNANATYDHERLRASCLSCLLGMPVRHEGSTRRKFLARRDVRLYCCCFCFVLHLCICVARLMMRGLLIFMPPPQQLACDIQSKVTDIALT